MSVELGIDEMDIYFEPIRRDANARLLGIKEPEFESFEEDDYSTDESDYSAEEDDTGFDNSTDEETPVEDPVEEEIIDTPIEEDSKNVEE